MVECMVNKYIDYAVFCLVGQANKFENYNSNNTAGSDHKPTGPRWWA